ncbi:MAG TPA: filamentous hemagglutinin N-terminal domain-containing protein, partial [Burkholderiales bacterium]|nr:filamentous hemagglutinin N-terminal domain-containing protein [Burkholderiales bacterium]
MAAGPGFRKPLIGVAVALCFGTPPAHANPSGPTVVNGSASFASSGGTLTVTNSPGAIINWQQFSIQQNEVTRFLQQSASSAVLNRVISGSPSALLGTLSSNGRVFLINASGITIGAGARIDVAGFAASTLNLSDSDFLAGRRLFQGTGGEGALSNAGRITTPEGGFVYLVAPKVDNGAEAVITSPKGEVVIAAGRTVELVGSREPDVRVEFTAGGEAVNAGEIVASSGYAGIFGTLVRESGRVSASRAEVGPGGKIVFRAAGDVMLEAGARVEATGDTGGTVQVLGRRVGVLDGAKIDASGDAGGGTVLVGGDLKGANPDVPNAWRTYFGADAEIRADAIRLGDGGKVIVWSDDITRSYGHISAQGGTQGGNGGFVEVSGRNLLDFASPVNAAAPLGRGGTLLLDPTNITVANGGGATTSQADAFADPGGTLSISPTTLNAAGTTVVLQASNDININSAVNLTTPSAGFVAQAGDDINVNASITTNGGQIHLEADSPHSTSGAANGSGTLAINAQVSSNGGHITLIGGGDSISNGGGISFGSPGNHVDAGAGGINVALAGNADLGIGSLGLITQILGNPTISGGDGSLANLRGTGALVIGTALTAGTNGLGSGALTLKANAISNVVANSAITLSGAAGSSVALVAGNGGIEIDQRFVSNQSTTIDTTGPFVLSAPLDTNNHNLAILNASSVDTTGGSITTGTGSIICTALVGCPSGSIGGLVNVWTFAGSGSWTLGSNWSLGHVPGSTEVALIGPAASPNTITL